MEDKKTAEKSTVTVSTLIRVSVVIAACVGFLAARIIWPWITFDAISITLLAIIILILLTPEIQRYFEEIQLGFLSAKTRQINRKVQTFIEDKEVAEDKLSKDPYIIQSEEPEYGSVATALQTDVDPRQILLLLSVEIEKAVREHLKKARIPEAKRPLSLSQMMHLGKSAGVFPEEMVKMIDEFWSVRNKVVHSIDVRIDNATVYALIDAGIDVLGSLSFGEGRSPAEYELPESVVERVEEATSRIEMEEKYPGSSIVNVALYNFFSGTSEIGKCPDIDHKIVDQTDWEKTRIMVFSVNNRWIEAVGYCAKQNGVPDSQVVFMALQKYFDSFTVVWTKTEL